MIKLKDLLKESTWNNRKFGEPLPTMADYKKAHDKKNIKEDFKNNKWEVYVADENRREKIVKVWEELAWSAEWGKSEVNVSNIQQKK